jgi:phenylacetic acid degradation operon negative regulatory protein
MLVTIIKDPHGGQVCGFGKASQNEQDHGHPSIRALMQIYLRRLAPAGMIRPRGAKNPCGIKNGPSQAQTICGTVLAAKWTKPCITGMARGLLTMHDPIHSSVRRLLLANPPRAGHFIVTLYGDVVEPRGGTLWMSQAISLCQAAGLSETLVRTAMSRLVAAGQLIGDRSGRRSYYRLTPAAKLEFARAEQVLFSPPAMPTDFAILAINGGQLPLGFVPLRPDLAIGPYRADLKAGAGFVLRASIDQGGVHVPEFVAGLWDMGPLAEAYQLVLDRFTPLLASLHAGGTLSPQDALVMRLLLVDGYRMAILRDPFLPHAALPPNWPGRSARSLFLRLYLRLSEAADSVILQDFAGTDGQHPEIPPQVAARQASLMAEAALQTP